jgi:L,D-transpeptidase YcbB
LDLLTWLIVGLVAGVLASFVVGGIGYGIVGDIIVGIVGAVLGGWLFTQMGWTTPFAGIAGTIFVAFIGAVVLLFVLSLLRGGRGRRLAAVLLAVGLPAAGCGGSAKLDALRADAIGAMLRTVAGDSVVHLASGDTLRVSSATLEFYRAREWQSAWVGTKRPLAQGTALHEALGRSWEDGLPPARYRHDVAIAVLDGLAATGDARLPDSLAVRHLADLDLLLTEGFNRLARDLIAGMLSPADAGLDYRIAAEAPPDDLILNRVLAGGAPSVIVAQLRPSIPQYERMRAALLAFHQIEARGGWERLEGDATLKPGERGDAVIALRQRFSAGMDGAEAALAGSGRADPSFFDADLKRAVERFQDRHAIAPDGAVGGTTLRELNHTIAERIAELQLNLDRWRWLPNDLGERYVLVNIAGFELEVVDGGQVIETMNVVVGQQSTETPIFADSIRFVVVNPYWNVPDGIMERTIRPAMARDANYLASNDMEIHQGRVRQRPGPKNSLGRYKFIFPNEHDVYLHDTPDGHLFSRTERAFSSGCVRIERPRDFARMLLRLQSSQDPESLDAIFATGREQWIKLDRPLPVFLLYFTAWAQDDGSVRFHHDVYGRSEAMDGQAEEMKPPALPAAPARSASRQPVPTS